MDKRYLRRDDELQKSVEQYIAYNYSSGININTAAAYCGVLPRHVGEAFRVNGTTFRKVLTAVRMEHAEALIRRKTKLAAVSLLTGYKSKKNFIRRWKQKYGVRPYEWYKANVYVEMDPRRKGTSIGIPMGVQEQGQEGQGR